LSHVKGSHLANTRGFILSSFGPDGYAKVAELLSPATREAIESVTGVGWYPVELHRELLHALDRAHDADRGHEVVRRAAASDIEFAVTRIHRLFFRFANPGFLLERATDIWVRFYDSGVWDVTRFTDTSAAGTLRDFAITDPLYCEYVRGFILRLFELVGAREPRTKHTKCRARGDAGCRFEGEWK
jgi:hypothetical protein